MDRISNLSDDVLLRILDLLPIKRRMTTSVLSKRYRNLWKQSTNLRFICRHGQEAEALSEFLNERLTEFVSPEIDIFAIKCYHGLLVPENVTNWVDFATARKVKKLVIIYEDRTELRNLLPTSLYTCRSIVSLCLAGSFFIEFPDDASFPVLESAEFDDIIGFVRQDLIHFLSISPVLNFLVLALNEEIESTYSVVHPTLRSLFIRRGVALDMIELHTPSLRKLRIHAINSHVISDDMPNLEEAIVNVGKEGTITGVIRAMRSVNKLTVCVNEGMDFFDAAYNNLKCLSLCDCQEAEKNVHFLLASSPNVTHLEIKPYEDHVRSNPGNFMIRYIPLCTYENLQYFVWFNYEGVQHAEEVLCKLRRKGLVLKTIRITFGENFLGGKHTLLQTLQSITPASRRCDLELEF